MNDLVPSSLAEKMAAWRGAAKQWRPHPYQERALKFILENAQSGLLLDPGLGKTSISLADMKVLLRKKMMKRALVVAPLRAVYDVWPAEISDWSDFHELNVAILHGPKKDSVLRSLAPCHQVALINPEGFQWLTARRERLKALGADVFFVDESSKWKDSTTARFRALRPVLPQFKRRHILTGSPRPKSYMDLFGQIYILDRGAALGSYVSHYRQNFFYPTGYQMREWAPLPDSPARIEALVAPLVLRLDAKDYLKLPKEMERIHRVDLPPKVMAEYARVEDNMMSALFESPLVHSAAARSKCCQIANGAVYTDPAPVEAGRWRAKERPYKVLHTAKVDALVDLYEELQGEPLLLSIGYHHDVAAVRLALGQGIPCINGQTTRGRSASFIDAWNRGSLPIMMVHPASAGHALNLQKFHARHVGFFDLPDDYDFFDQVYKRVNRQGNKADWVMRHLFVANDTVDEAKLRNLRRKEAGQGAFLRAMKEYCEAKYGSPRGLKPASL